jgi:hypothetical protein
MREGAIVREVGEGSIVVDIIYYGASVMCMKKQKEVGNQGK